MNIKKSSLQVLIFNIKNKITNPKHNKKIYKMKEMKEKKEMKEIKNMKEVKKMIKMKETIKFLLKIFQLLGINLI